MCTYYLMSFFLVEDIIMDLTEPNSLTTEVSRHQLEQEQDLAPHMPNTELIPLRLWSPGPQMPQPSVLYPPPLFNPKPPSWSTFPCNSLANLNLYLEDPFICHTISKFSFFIPLPLLGLSWRRSTYDHPLNDFLCVLNPNQGVIFDLIVALSIVFIILALFFRVTKKFVPEIKPRGCVNFIDCFPMTEFHFQNIFARKSWVSRTKKCFLWIICLSFCHFNISNSKLQS